MADVIKEYAFKISVEGSKAVIKEFKEISKIENKQNKELKQTNSLLWTYAKRLVSIYAIYKLFKKGFNLSASFVEQGNALRNLSTSVNISAKSLQKWGYLAKKFGGNEQSVAQTMGNLQSKLYNLKNFGDVSPFLEYMQKFGNLPVGTNAEEFLIDLSEKLKGLDEDTQREMLNALGIDSAMGLLLRSGNIEEKLKSAKVLFTDEQIAKAEKVKSLMIDFNHELAKMNLLLGEIFLPVMIKAMKKIQEFLQNPKKVVLDSLINTAKNSPMGLIYRGEKALYDWLSGGQSAEDRRSSLKSLDYSAFALDKMASMNYDLGRFSDLRAMGNVSVYNENAININGAKTPEQIAQAVAGNIICISDHSLTIAGLGFASKRK